MGIAASSGSVHTYTRHVALVLFLCKIALLVGCLWSHAVASRVLMMLVSPLVAVGNTMLVLCNPLGDCSLCVKEGFAVAPVFG